MRCSSVSVLAAPGVSPGMPRKREAAKAAAAATAAVETEYIVESVLDTRPDPSRRTAVQFLIKWEGWNDPTWEDNTNCDGCRGAIAEFVRNRAKELGGGVVKNKDEGTLKGTFGDGMEVEDHEDGDKEDHEDSNKVAQIFDDDEDSDLDEIDEAAKERRATRLGGADEDDACVSFAASADCAPSSRRTWTSKCRFMEHQGTLWRNSRLTDEEEDRLERLSELNYACLALAKGEVVKYADVPCLRKQAAPNTDDDSDDSSAAPAAVVRRYICPDGCKAEDMLLSSFIVGAQSASWALQLAN